MPRIDVQAPRPLCPTGDHIVTLAEVKVVPLTNFNTGEPEDKLLWRFVSHRTDEDGLNYEIPIFTGFKYGHPASTMTWLIDMISPGISVAKVVADGLDTEQFVGKKFEGPVKHEPTKKDPSVKKAVFMYLRPMSEASAAQATANSGGPDPFEFDEKETAEDIQAAFKAAQAEIASLKAREGKHGVTA